MRGIAILLVLDFHATRPLLFIPILWLGFPHFGWTGVDIFFVLSGFLIGGLLIKETTLFGRTNTKQFLIRRALKLWPQYYVLLAFRHFFQHVSFDELWGDFLHIQNFIGYINYTWSLALEVQAYLFIVIFFAAAAHWRLSVKQLIAIPASLIALLLVLRFTLNPPTELAFRLLSTRVDGILYGVILAILCHEKPQSSENPESTLAPRDTRNSSRRRISFPQSF